MDDLVSKWGDAQDGRDVFLRCYRMMTLNMLDALDRDEFIDSDWVYRLLVRFADYYYDALDGYESSGKSAPGVWQVAYDCARKRDTQVIQNLLLGVNAHINYDLVFALVDVWGDDRDNLNPDRIRIRYADHCKINQVIAATIDAVQDDVIETESPGMDIVDKMMGPIDEWLISELVTRWRDTVWDQAMELIRNSDTSFFEIKRQQVEDVTLKKADAILMSDGISQLRILI